MELANRKFDNQNKRVSASCVRTDRHENIGYHCMKTDDRGTVTGDFPVITHYHETGTGDRLAITGFRLTLTGKFASVTGDHRKNTGDPPVVTGYRRAKTGDCIVVTPFCRVGTGIRLEVPAKMKLRRCLFERFLPAQGMVLK